jgi:hypothetical protein
MTFSSSPRRFIEKASRLYEQERRTVSAASPLEMYVKRWLGWVRNGVKTVWRGWTETGGVPPDISTAKKKDRLAAASPKSD